MGFLKKKNEKGMILLIVLSVVVVVAVATTSIIMISNSEMNMEERQDNSTKSFYLAEAGIEFARTQLNSDWTDQSNISSSLGDGTTSVSISTNDSSGVPLVETNQLRIRSVGNVSGVQRSIDVIISSITPPALSSAVSTNGTLTLQGSAVITPAGSIVEHAGLVFETTFGITKAEMKELARSYGTVYDAAILNDVVTGITWVEDATNMSKITSNTWNGSGILVIIGDLKISGGDFNGVLWVEGGLFISGNTEINGALFVESGVTVDTTVTGTADITLDSDEIDAAFSGLPPFIESWREV